MRSFLVRNKKPICKWGQLPDETYYIGEVPEGYSLGISPSKGFVVIDVDRHGGKDGFDNVPDYILKELQKSFNYPTKNNGHHYWVKYSGNKPLGNKTSGLGIDLRNERGYVVWYPSIDPKDAMKQVNDSSEKLNQWLEKLFSFKYDLVV